MQRLEGGHADNRRHEEPDGDRTDGEETPDHASRIALTR
jgi:hypothetical protein